MMTKREVLAELVAAAHQEWAGIFILSTTHFEPELRATAPRCIAAARRRLDALVIAARTLEPGVDLTGLPRAT